jgi:DNA-binding CsgD family transcriptional regulator
MGSNPILTKRENEIIDLLLEGKSNKEIASILGIKEGTVESHLTSIYAKLGVSSRAEAILAWQEFQNLPWWVNFFRKFKLAILLGILLSIALAITLEYYVKPKTWEFERECEYPNEYTLGQTIQRSQASRKEVHGQFGAIDKEPWSGKAGYVAYTNINIPQMDHLFLKLRYSKFSPSSVQILIFLDDENYPRASIQPVDQGDWNKFFWTNPIDLGPIEGGLHTLKFVTEGQKYGVADLDIFELKE